MKNTVSVEELQAMCRKLLMRKFQGIDTDIKNKKVYFDHSDLVDIENSKVVPAEKSALPGMMKTKMCYRIPDEAHHIRFFVYWNDKNRTDVDLHAYCYDEDGELYHVGWNAYYNSENNVVMSGDITHSNAAEYIDINLDGENVPQYVACKIDVFYAPAKGDGYHNSFSNINTCFCGLMAVNNLDENVKQYDAKNCFYSTDLTVANAKSITYGLIDLKRRCIFFIGKYEGRSSYMSWRKSLIDEYEAIENGFSIREYMDIVLTAQGAVEVDTKEEADICISVTPRENCLALTDVNFWMDI